MTRLAVILRLAGLLAVVAAVCDPGCARRPTYRVDVAFAGELPTELRNSEMARMAAAAPWARVVEEHTSNASTGDERAVARVLVGDPGPVVDALRRRRADLAWQPADGAPAIARLWAPARIVAGTQGAVEVGIEGMSAAGGALTVVVRDADTGLEQGRTERPIGPGDVGLLRVHVPWLATGLGVRRLRVQATPVGGAARVSAPADVTVDVLPATVAVHVLEARPTWGTRFARLALATTPGIEVRTEARFAPGVAVRTDGPHATRGADAGEAQVVLVGGVEALTSADVARLERDVRERGRALVLVLDEAPGAGPWRRLWPDGTGAPRSAPRAVAGAVAGHPWRMREWLTPSLSMGATPLAYLDSEASGPGGPPSFAAGRALGAGRVVLMGALDAWRYRADEGVAFAEGWRALVQRLAADVPPPVATTAWVAGAGRDTRVEVDVALRPDVVALGAVSVSAELGAPQRTPVPLWQVESGRWRGSIRVPGQAGTRLRVEVRRDARVVGQTETRIDLATAATAAAWQDVTRMQEARGQRATGSADHAERLAQLRDADTAPASTRWYVTRTWPFAAAVLAVLGAEWILRRLLGQR